MRRKNGMDRKHRAGLYLRCLLYTSDTMYTNTDGYLEDFGHYRGFLRVPIDKLWNEDASRSYKQLTTCLLYTSRCV